jgi:putative thiamine transport system permease protein
VTVRPSTAVRTGRGLARFAAGLLFALPIAAALPLAVNEGLSAGAWHALLDDPQLPRALTLSVFTALASTVLATAVTLWIVTHLHGTKAWARLASALGPMLALPHAAFAIGLAWLIAPAGAIARLIAPLAGWSTPPQWVTVNDPQGITLVAVLLFKELPFLIWSVLALLARPEVAAALQRQIAVARTLGYRPRAWLWRVGWLEWAPRLAWPVIAVLAYGLTVVDLALIVGPGSPPTLAVLAWQGLTDANVARNTQGAAAALLLTAVLALLVAAGAGVTRMLGRWARRRATDGVREPRPRTDRPVAAQAALGLVAALYAAVVLALGVLSVAGVWTFPARWPQVLSVAAWEQVVISAPTVGFTAALALAASASAVVLTLAWLEAAPVRWDGRITPLVLAPLVIPQLLLMVGLYRGALALHIDGSAFALGWVHTLMVLPYTFTALAPAWRSFDHRLEWTALALGRSRLVFWWRVKWPLLAAPLASALAIGFAVSVAQYLATQFIGAGRHATVTTEAVTLASGGQRTLAAAFALLQALLPALGFGLAALVQRRSGPSPRGLRRRPPRGEPPAWDAPARPTMLP